MSCADQPAGPVSSGQYIGNDGGQLLDFHNSVSTTCLPPADAGLADGGDALNIITQTIPGHPSQQHISLF